MKYVAWFWRNTAGIRGNIVLRVVLGIARVLLGLWVVWLSKQFIDDTIRNGSNEDVFRMAGILLFTVLAGVLLRQAYVYISTCANIRKTNELRLNLFNQLFERRLYGEKILLSGDVTSRMSKDVEKVCDVTADTIPQILVTFAQLVGAFLMMRWFDARLAWALLVLTFISTFAGKFIAHKLRQMTLDIREEESRIQMRIQESVEHNMVLRSLGSEDWMRQGLDAMQTRLKELTLRRTRFTVVTRVLIGSAFGLGYMLAFIWGGIGLRNGVITFGVMTSFLQLVMQIQQPILTLLNTAPQLIHATASVDRLGELGEDLVDVSENQDVVNSISLKNVTFKYPSGDRNVIENFSHDFKQGTRTAVMGETGSGKTTLFRLMLGLLKPSEGTIEPASISENFRQDFIYVPQGNTLMSGSVRFNLQVAKPTASDEELQQVLHTACADFVNQLPRGLDTNLGELGSGLSEGQAQRIAIARGLLRPGNVLLLDEISASLDESTEQELYRRIFAAYPQKTMIFITHRKAVCELCDDVIHIG